MLHQWKINGPPFIGFCDKKEALPLMTLRIGFTVTWPQMVFVVPTHPVTIMLSKLQRILPHWLLEKSRRKMMKQLLWADLFFLSKADLLASCSTPWQGKEKNPTWKRDGLQLYFTSVSGVGWLPANNSWCAGTSGKTDFYSYFFTPAW